jgi:hypothetical protein
MPIKPENRAKYPADWKEIRERIRQRAGNCCEFCGIGNHLIGYRIYGGSFRRLRDVKPGTMLETQGGLRVKAFRIVCTVAHLNHTLEDHRDEVLAFLCQRCHLAHDAPQHAESRRKNRAKGGKANVKV